MKWPYPMIKRRPQERLAPPSCHHHRNGSINVTVFAGVQLVAAVSAPGANVAEIARRADLRPNQIYRWRRQMAQASLSFAEVQVQPDPMPVSGSAIIVEFERAIVRIPAGASPGLVSAVLRSVDPSSLCVARPQNVADNWL
jgi:transposase